MTKNIHGIFVAILVVYLTEMRSVLCEQRCNSTWKCSSGTYCCFGTMVCRSNCTKVFCESDGDCLKSKCCNEKRNKCSKRACHKNDDPYWQPLVYGTVVIVALLFLGVCSYSFCFTIPRSCLERSARNTTVTGTSNGGHDDADAGEGGGNETQNDG